MGNFIFCVVSEITKNKQVVEMKFSSINFGVD